MNVSDLDGDMEPVDFTATSRRPMPVAVPAPQAPVDDPFFSDPLPAAPVQPTPQAPAPATPLQAAVEVGREGPVPAAVAKMRSILGMNATKVVQVPIYVNGNKDPDFVIGLRPITSDDYQWMSQIMLRDPSLATQPALLQLMWDIALVSIATASLDTTPKLPHEAPTPVWKALEMEPENSAHVRNPYYPHTTLRFACASILFDEYRSSMQEFVDILTKAYREKVEPQNQLGMSPLEVRKAAEVANAAKTKKAKKENPTTRGS